MNIEKQLLLNYEKKIISLIIINYFKFNIIFSNIKNNLKYDKYLSQYSRHEKKNNTCEKKRFSLYYKKYS